MVPPQVDTAFIKNLPFWGPWELERMQVTSVVHRGKKLSDGELIIKLASSSVGERIFRDLRSEIYIPSEKKNC